MSKAAPHRAARPAWALEKTTGTMGHGFRVILHNVDRVWLLAGPSVLKGREGRFGTGTRGFPAGSK